jgi:O-glycosyl hydrolase
VHSFTGLVSDHFLLIDACLAPDPVFFDLFSPLARYVLTSRKIGAQADSNAAGLVTLTGSGSSTVVTPSGILWAFAMFSRYIRPDAVRVETSGAPSNTNIAAFQNTDGTVVVVMINGGSSTESVSLASISVSSVTAYYMDNSVSSPATFSTTLSGGVVEATLPAYSVVTFVLSVGQSSTTTSPIKSTTSTTSTIKSTTSTTTSSATSSSTSLAQEWGQCGGDYWTGPTACVSPYTCQYQNPYYSQCL